MPRQANEMMQKLLQRKPPRKMLKDVALQMFEEEQCCKICTSPLTLPPALINGKKSGILIKNGLRINFRAPQKDNELVVAAVCGHIFHKFCLRHYCYTYQKGGNHPTDKVECPVCFQFISMTKVQNIEFKAHFCKGTTLDKACKVDAAMNKELIHQVLQVKAKFAKLEGAYAEAKLKVKSYSQHEKKLIMRENSFQANADERDKLYYEIDRCNQSIDFMHAENVRLVRIYLSYMQDLPYEKLQDKKIPPMLIPYLKLIMEDDVLARKFGEILKPVEMDGVKSNPELLLVEILQLAQPRAMELARIKSLANDELKKIKQGPEKIKPKAQTKPKPRAVLVKVERSSISLFCKSDLSKETVEDIMSQVKVPTRDLKEVRKHGGARTRETLIKGSVSEIQVIFKANKRRAETDPNPINVLDCDSDIFSIRNIIPPRRCRSTEPILMKTCKGLRTLIEKVGDLRDVEVSAGDQKELPIQSEGFQANSQGDTQQRSEPLAVPAKVNHSTQTFIIERRDNHESVQNPGRSKMAQKTNSWIPKVCQNQVTATNSVISDYGLENFGGSSSSCYTKKHQSKSSAGFQPKIKGSAFDIIFNRIVEEDMSAARSLNEMSKLGLRNRNKVRFEDHESSTLQDEIKRLVPPKTNQYQRRGMGDDDARVEPKLQVTEKEDEINDSDIEDGFKLSEIREPKPKPVKQSNFNPEDYQDSGILPGPFTKRYQDDSSFVKNQQPPLPIQPVYLSNWMNKLPSAKLRMKAESAKGTMYYGNGNDLSTLTAASYNNSALPPINLSRVKSPCEPMQIYTPSKPPVTVTLPPLPEIPCHKVRQSSSRNNLNHLQECIIDMPSSHASLRPQNSNRSNRQFKYNHSNSSFHHPHHQAQNFPNVVDYDHYYPQMACEDWNCTPEFNNNTHRSNNTSNNRCPPILSERERNADQNPLNRLVRVRNHDNMYSNTTISSNGLYLSNRKSHRSLGKPSHIHVVVQPTFSTTRPNSLQIASWRFANFIPPNYQQPHQVEQDPYQTPGLFPPHPQLQFEHAQPQSFHGNGWQPHAHLLHESFRPTESNLYPSSRVMRRDLCIDERNNSQDNFHQQQQHHLSSCGSDFYQNVSSNSTRGLAHVAGLAQMCKKVAPPGRSLRQNGHPVDGKDNFLKRSRNHYPSLRNIHCINPTPRPEDDDHHHEILNHESQLPLLESSSTLIVVDELNYPHHHSRRNNIHKNVTFAPEPELNRPIGFLKQQKQFVPPPGLTPRSIKRAKRKCEHP